MTDADEKVKLNHKQRKYYSKKAIQILEDILDADESDKVTNPKVLAEKRHAAELLLKSLNEDFKPQQRSTKLDIPQGLVHINLGDKQIEAQQKLKELEYKEKQQEASKGDNSDPSATPNHPEPKPNDPPSPKPPAGWGS